MGIVKGIERVKVTRMIENQRSRMLEQEGSEREIEVESVDDLGEIINYVQIEQFKTISEGIMEDLNYIKTYT